MAARFRLNHEGVGQFLKSAELQAAVLRVGEKIRDTAVAISPVGDAAYDIHPGLYKASWRVKVIKDGGFKHDRAMATVTNTTPYARWVEYGNGRAGGTRHHVALRAALVGGR